MLLIATGGMSLMAQGGGFQQRTPEERLKPVHFKIDSAFKLDADIMKKVDDLFLATYKESDKVREEMIPAHPFARCARGCVEQAGRGCAEQGEPWRSAYADIVLNYVSICF